jgi:RHS repeat-associated protein
MDYGWLGQYQRPYEHTGALSLVQMGARPYSPLLGRFLSGDSVEGGSANDYDYVTGDPINATDLDGTMWGWLKAAVHVVTKVAEVASWIPGPIGAVAGGVAAAGNAIQGNWGRAAMYAAGAITMGAATVAVKAVRIVRAATGLAGGIRASRLTSRVAGRVWVGRGAVKKPADNGWRLYSSNGLRQYRYPKLKTGPQTAKYGRWQSNFEWRAAPTGKMTTNDHVRHRRSW